MGISMVITDIEKLISSQKQFIDFICIISQALNVSITVKHHFNHKISLNRIKIINRKVKYILYAFVFMDTRYISMCSRQSLYYISESDLILFSNCFVSSDACLAYPIVSLM